MKSLIVFLVLLVCPQLSLAAVDGWRMNQFTGKPDYYQTGVDSATVADIAAVTKTGAGDYAVFFANDFASTAYVCLCSTGRAEADDYGDCVVQGAPSSGGSITVATYDNTTTKTDRARVFMICVGAQ